MFKCISLMKSVMLLCVFLLAGCGSFLKAPTKYDSPQNSTDVAKIRLMGNPLYPYIYQEDKLGRPVGGFIVEHNRFLNLGFGTTVDIGLPKIHRNDYSGKYFETVIAANVKTTVEYLVPGCKVSLKFTPKKEGVYEVTYSDTDKTGCCVLYIRSVEFDKINEIYVEGNIK